MISLKEKQHLAGIKSAQIMKQMKEKRIESYNNSPKLCSECKNPIAYEKRRNKFCGHTCGAIYGNRKRTESGWNHSEITIKKLKKSGKKYGKLSYTKMQKEKVIIICKSCKTEFKVVPSHSKRKYCSRQCAYIDKEKYKNCGGYRPGSGHAKPGYYKGIYCGSTYELCWVIWALDNEIKFTRFSGILEGNEVKYVPDFLLDDGKTIIELKGYENQELVDKKTQLAENMGYAVSVLRKDDLQDIFQYVKQKYNTNKFYTLYDK